MSLTEDKEKLRSKADKLSRAALFMEADEYDKGANTKETRNQYMRLVHYYHILDQMGEDRSPDARNSESLAYSLLKEKITKISDKDCQRKEVIRVNLISEHNAAFNMAEYFYEKASKSLCQMMITIMDYILQEKGNMSVLYTKETEQHRSYFSLLDEIEALNEDYLDSYFYLCAFDYCTEQITSYMDIKEYKQLIKEHERIIINGIPSRVTHTLEILKDIIREDNQKAEIFMDIEKAFTPEPPYDRAVLDMCYRKVLEEKFDNNIDVAMSGFSNLVIALDYTYAHCFL